YLLRRDPLTQGRMVLEQKCLSCHYYQGKGQVTELTYEVTADDLAKLASAPKAGDVPEVVAKALASKAKNATLGPGQPVRTPSGVTGYRFEGTNPQGEKVEAVVKADGSSVALTVWSKQSASDLAHYGSRYWVWSLLQEPGSDRFFGKVPQCGGM